MANASQPSRTLNVPTWRDRVNAAVATGRFTESDRQDDIDGNGIWRELRVPKLASGYPFDEHLSGLCINFSVAVVFSDVEIAAELLDRIYERAELLKAAA